MKHKIRHILIRILKYFNYLISRMVLLCVKVKKIRSSAVKKTDNTKRKLLIDCSFTYNSDLNTGIQRVVRNIIKNIKPYAQENNLELHIVTLLNNVIVEVDIDELRVKKNTTNSKIHMLYSKIATILKNHYSSCKNDIVPIYEDDILLIIDSVWGLDIWESIKYVKERKVKIVGVAYDLIPITHPQFCDAGLVKHFDEWYKQSLQYFDGYVAISKTVMNDMKKYISDIGINPNNYFFDYFYLGSDFQKRKKQDFSVREELKELYKYKKSVYLIVSTIEPRKNHKYLFEVFKKLWKLNIDASLVIVGKQGWLVDDLVLEMKNHIRYQENLWIFNDLNDEELSFCYKYSKALLFPSFVEGYGLPIVESLKNGLPVFASDTPIHREIGKDLIEYFDISNTDSLVSMLYDIETKKKKLKQLNSNTIEIYTWEDSAKELLEKILKEE